MASGSTTNYSFPYPIPTDSVDFTGDMEGLAVSIDTTLTSFATNISDKAPLASPALSGTPTAPTAASGTNTTQIATTAFVQSATAALVDSAPTTLDTLNELAAALGDDANFATTITNSIAGKQPLDADLTAIAGLTGTSGLLKKTAANTWTLDTTEYTTNTGTVTSVAMTVPTGLSVSGTPVTTSGTIAISLASGYIIPTATALDAKAPLASPTFTGTVTLPSTTSIGSVSSTELGYLDGVTSAIQTQLNAKASLASPALSGTPTAPTAASGTNTTQIATTAFVVDAISNAPSGSGTVTSVAMTVPTGLSVSGTPITESGTLAISLASGYKIPTIVELDAKAPLASPDFSGIPTAPTATSGTNTTQIATTAFVQSAITGTGQLPSVSGQSGKYLYTDGLSAFWQELPGTNTFSIVVSSNVQEVLDSFDKNSYGSAEYIVQADQPGASRRTLMKILVVHDGTSSYTTTFGLIELGASRIPMDVYANINGSNVELQVQIDDASTNNVEFNIVKTNVLL